MTTLSTRLGLVDALVGEVETSRRNQHVRARLEQRAREWDEHRSKLIVCQGRAEWAGLQLEHVTAFAQKRQQLALIAKEASARLTTGEDVTALTEDPLWTRLLKSAVTATEVLDEAVRRAWREHVENLGSLDSPGMLEASLPKTPTNRQALETLRPLYAEFKKLSEHPTPRGPDDKLRLEKLVTECRQVLTKLQRDVPREVDEFFRAVDAFAATLSNVTPQVLRWLDENGQLGRYQVRISEK